MFMCMHMLMRMHMHMHMCMHMHMHMLHAHAHVHVYMHMHMHMHMHMCMYMCMCMCVHVHVHVHAHMYMFFQASTNFTPCLKRLEDVLVTFTPCSRGRLQCRWCRIRVSQSYTSRSRVYQQCRSEPPLLRHALCGIAAAAPHT